MIKRILIGIVIVGILGAGSFAEPRTFVGLYWVVGQLSRGAGVDPATTLSGRNAVFYVSGSDPVAGTYKINATTAADGSFIINPLLNRDIPIDYSTNYYSAAVVRGADNYGANPESITILNEQGYKNVALSLLSGAGPTGPIGLVDTGWVRNTNIIKEGNNLKLTWGFDPARGATDVFIYVPVAAGPGSEYPATAVAGTWRILTSATPGTTTFTHAGAAGSADNNNYYYRIVPQAAPAEDILNATWNSISAGAVKSDLPNNKYVFCGMPFQEDGISLQGKLGDQIGNDGEYYWWNGVGNPGATYSGGSWRGDDRNLSIGEGFYIRAKSDKRLVLTGRFGTLASPAVKHLTGGRYSLIAYPYPTSKVIGDTGIVPDSDATILKWYVDPAITPHDPPLTQANDGATYSGGRWVGPTDVPNFELGRPRMYKPTGDFDWGIRFP